MPIVAVIICCEKPSSSYKTCFSKSVFEVSRWCWAMWFLTWRNDSKSIKFIKTLPFWISFGLITAVVFCWSATLISSLRDINWDITVILTVKQTEKKGAIRASKLMIFIKFHHSVDRIRSVSSCLYLLFHATRLSEINHIKLELVVQINQMIAQGLHNNQ